MKILSKFFGAIGQYVILMGKVFSRPEKAGIYYRRILVEIDALGINSMPLVAIISIFIGAVITLQMGITLESPFIPKFMIGYATRETMTLEFSSTVIAIILAGKVGSNIASEIGTMRITEQIDALEIMGVNSASYLILPKIVATVISSRFWRCSVCLSEQSEVILSPSSRALCCQPSISKDCITTLFHSRLPTR